MSAPVARIEALPRARAVCPDCDDVHPADVSVRVCDGRATIVVAFTCPRTGRHVVSREMFSPDDD